MLYHFPIYVTLNNRDFEIWVRGHSRSFKLVPFESLGAVFYLPSTVTMALSCIICEIKADTGQKLWFFPYPLAYNTAIQGVHVGILPSRLVWKNKNGGAIRWWKNFEDMCNRSDTILVCDGRTDILPRHSPRYAYASCGNKMTYHTYNAFWLIHRVPKKCPRPSKVQ